MSNAHLNDEKIHLNNTFTELFTLIKKYKVKNQTIGLDYNIKEITKMALYADNAITTMLHGLQSIGSLVSMSNLSNKDDIIHIGCLLTLIGNLMEALHLLSQDCEHELRGDVKNKMSKIF